jgi:hypothetical protein
MHDSLLSCSIMTTKHTSWTIYSGFLIHRQSSVVLTESKFVHSQESMAHNTATNTLSITDVCNNDYSNLRSGKWIVLSWISVKQSNVDIIMVFIGIILNLHLLSARVSMWVILSPVEATQQLQHRNHAILYHQFENNVRIELNLFNK